jgi:hypothetical protein
MFQFNPRGLLVPETIIPASLAEFKEEFSVKLNTGKRKELFEQYELYCSGLKDICGNAALTQWVDGSYISQAKILLILI